MAHKTETNRASSSPVPLGVGLISIGIGLYWAALHAPQDVARMGAATLLEWCVESVTAALVSLCILKIAVSAVGCMIRAVRVWCDSARR